jgi:arsenite methyltransferase
LGAICAGRLAGGFRECASHIELAQKRQQSSITPTPAQMQANQIVLGAGFVERRKNYIRSLSEGSLKSVVFVPAKP